MDSCIKSSKGEEELEAKFAVSVLGGNVTETHTFKLPEDAGERQMFIIDKKRQTPKSTQENQGRLIRLLYLKNNA